MSIRSEALVNADAARKAGAIIGEGCLIFGRLDTWKPGFVTIGKCTQVASEAMLLCHGYFGTDAWLPIIVGEYSYIGWRALILPGAVIGNHCVIGAGAVVPKAHPIPDWSLVVGNPARIVRKLNERPEDIEKHRLYVKHMEGFIGK